MEAPPARGPDAEVRKAAPRPSCLWRLFLTLLGCVVAELVFDLVGGPLGVDVERLDRHQRLVVDGICDFEPRPHTVYTRSTLAPGRNSLGFRGPEWKLEKTPGVWRILCLGSSTTEAGNHAGPRGSYPVQLELGLRELGLEVEVLNAGIAAWSSAEVLVSWFLTLQDYAADLVVIHEAISDVPPRLLPGFRPDYTHWRHSWEMPRFGGLQKLLVRGSDLYTWLFFVEPDLEIMALTAHPTVPGTPLVPDTARAFERNVRTVAESAERNGAAVLLLTVPVRPGPPSAHEDAYVQGTREHNQITRELAVAHGWMLADAATSMEADPGLRGEFSDICHLSPKGNAAKARVVIETLRQEWAPARASSK